MKQAPADSLNRLRIGVRHRLRHRNQLSTGSDPQVMVARRDRRAPRPSRSAPPRAPPVRQPLSSGPQANPESSTTRATLQNRNHPLPYRKTSDILRRRSPPREARPPRHPERNPYEKTPPLRPEAPLGSPELDGPRRHRHDRRRAPGARHSHSRRPDGRHHHSGERSRGRPLRRRRRHDLQHHPDQHQQRGPLLRPGLDEPVRQRHQVPLAQRPRRGDQDRLRWPGHTHGDRRRPQGRRLHPADRL